MNYRIIGTAIVFCLLALPSGFITSACAQELKIAVVDIDQVSDEYRELAEKQQELQNWVNEKRAFMENIQLYLFVSSEEFQEVITIHQTPRAQWSEEQKKREADLRKVSEENERIFRELQAKPARTAQEQNQFNTLSDTLDARDRDMQVIASTFHQELQKRRDGLQTQLVDNVRAVIEAAAKAKNFTLVLDKSAVFYSATPIEDLTADILQRLNQGGVPPAAGENGGEEQ